jgi:hypothetical protein
LPSTCASLVSGAVISGRTASASLTFMLRLTVELGTVVLDAAGADPNCHLSITRARKAIVTTIESIKDRNDKNI